MALASDLILTEHKSFLNVGGLFANEKGFLKITGEDRTDFLHRLTSQDIKNLSSGTGASSALLEPAATILAFFDIYNCGQFFLIVIDKEHLKACHETLEKFHFAENVSIADVSHEFKFISVQGLRIEGMTKTSLGRIPKRENEIIGLEECFVILKSDFNKSNVGYHLVIKEEYSEQVIKALEKQGL